MHLAKPENILQLHLTPHQLNAVTLFTIYYTCSYRMLAKENYSGAAAAALLTSIIDLQHLTYILELV